MGCFPSKRAAEHQVHPSQGDVAGQVPLEDRAAPKPGENGGAMGSGGMTGSAPAISKLQAPASSRASTPNTQRKVSPVTKSEPLLQQAAAAGAPESVTAKPGSLAYEIPIDATLKSTEGSKTGEGSGGLHNQAPFQIVEKETDPEELRRKLEEKEALAAERRQQELAKREEVLRSQEEHARAVKERRNQRLSNADELGEPESAGSGIRKANSRKMDADPIAEEDEE
ncbi:hypothetical protein DFJ74DRAFT_707215 [Hyaloraphidium curvatum]|nr:hypothetical protein DFJ74DRAFT_707215 [Hyaloraphidium curvatum]